MAQAHRCQGGGIASYRRCIVARQLATAQRVFTPVDTFIRVQQEVLVCSEDSMQCKNTLPPESA